MASWLWRWVFVGIVLTLVILVLITPDPESVGLTSARTDELVALLGSPQSSLRRLAVEQLIARSKTIVPSLVDVATHSHGAQLEQALDVLEELLIGLDPVVSEEVELALEQLLDHQDREIASAAAYVMYRNSTLRHGRAVAHVEQMGGRIRSEPHNVIVNPRPSWRTYEMGEPPDESVRPIFLNLAVLDTGWTGGDEGLKYVRRLFPGEGLAVHIGDDVPISDAALDELQSSRHNLILRRPKEGCLGILLDDRMNTVFVNGILPLSPADRSGILPGDVIVQIEDQRPLNKPQLMAFTQKLQPDQVVSLTIRRRGVEHNFDIRLSSDFGTGLCRCTDQSALRPTPVDTLPGPP